MKILLLGDASNYHRALAGGLSRLGHEVAVASDGSSWMQTGCDIDISRGRLPGPLGGMQLWLRLKGMLRRELRGYDVVQLASPVFAELRPERLRPIFDELKRGNGAVYLTALGTDSVYVGAMTGENPPLSYSEWHVDKDLTAWGYSEVSERERWLAPVLRDYTEYVYQHVDGAVSALYEYDRVVAETHPGLPLAYGGIPVDIHSLPEPGKRDARQTVRIYLAAHKGREREKGADVLFPLVREMVEGLPEGTAEIVSPPNMPYGEFVRFLGDVDVLVDQLYSYTPATSALLAMAQGGVAVSGGEKAYADFIGYNGELPIINADPRAPEESVERLKALLLNREELERMQREAREFVMAHNSAEVVARRFVDFWTRGR